ncbi:hypothetical protein ACHAPT_006559 [Fusarium lateritium]
MTLLSLPQELLVKVVKELHLSDVETLAQTFSKRIHATCMPFLTKRIAARKHANRMTECFGPVATHNHLSKLSGEIAGLLGFDGVGEIALPDGPTSVEYLNLNGDLSWMEPLDQHTAGAMEGHHLGPATKDSKLIDKLIADAEKLGLELPDGFVTFMRSEEMQYRIPSAQAAFFTLGEDGFHKCPESMDNGLGGYVIRFYVDQQWCWIWNLYLYPGGHAVLGSSRNLNCHPKEAADLLLEAEKATQEEIDRAEEMGFPLTYAGDNDLVLHSLDFEAFLATTYYEELVFFVIHEDAKVSKGLRDYLDHNYRRKEKQAQEEQAQEQVEEIS